MATSRKWIRAVFGLNKSSKLKSSEKDQSNKFKSSEKDAWSKFRSLEKDESSKFKSSEKDEQNSGDIKHNNEMKSYTDENQLDSQVVSAIDSAKDAYITSMKDSDEIDSGSIDEIDSGNIDEIWQQKEHYNEIESNTIENQFDIDVSDIDSAKDTNFGSAKDFGEFDRNTFEYELNPNGISKFEGANNASFLSARQSVDISGDIPENELNFDAKIEHSQGLDFQSISDPSSRLSTSFLVTEIENTEDTSVQSVLDSSGSPSTSLQVQNTTPIQQSMSEECATIRIQAAFKKFLARRALRSFRGIVRLHGLTGSHAVKKQVSLALHSMQDLVRVQTRSRTRQGSVALENQIARQNVQKHFEHENREKERKFVNSHKIEWCDRAGSAEEVRAKALKRKEAASRREKAMAYALARQWQAGSRQRVKPVAAVGGKDIKVYWSWKWLESWLASSQWEIQFLDTDVEDGKRKLARSSSNKSSMSNEGISSPNCSPPMKSPNLKDPMAPRMLPIPRTTTLCPRTVTNGSVEESTLRLSLGPRSRSTPRGRSPLGDINGKTRLSLPENGPHSGVQPAKQPNQPPMKRSNTAPRPHMPKTKNRTN